MDLDIIFVVGIFVAVLAIPSIVSCFADGRAPRIPALVMLIAAAMVGYAVYMAPDAYTLGQLPDIMVRTIGKALN